MRFKNQQQGSSVPEVNLIPLLDVLMSVLTFFIIASMSLTSQKLANISLPGAGAGMNEQKTPEQLIVGLDKQGKLLLKGETINSAKLAKEMGSFLAEHPQGAVILKADRELPYQEVVKVLKEMGKLGGNRVSLSITRS
ncbi:MAG: biopolymer transporter ExbD [Symploca sp. SIO1A3]|nr:biopolymer transporter ExbD [Symploca sp. SIO2C1]NER50847.1 biopolymer transporter ExbD [Symploca sp. SIO1A3]